MRARARPMVRAGLMGAVLLLSAASGAPAQQTASGPTALITGVQLRRDAAGLHLQFLLKGNAATEVVANPRQRVAVIKFNGAQPAFPDGRTVFAYNDPMLEGIAFEVLDERTAWAKLRLRTDAVSVQAAERQPKGAVVVDLRPAPPPADVELVAVRLGRINGNSRVVLDVTRLPQYELREQEGQTLLVLKDTAPGAGLLAEGEDERVTLRAPEREGRDTLVRIETKLPSRVAPAVLTDPARVVLDFGPREAEAAIVPGVPAAPRAPIAESLEDLLAQEPNPAVRANYVLAEREFRAGNYPFAAQLFQRVYNSSPRSRLGLRAYFRASDASYEALRARRATNFHAVITSYQAAIRAAEEARYESELIPRAFFQIGRAYQQMGFYVEAIVHYEILEERFPDSLPYGPDSYYYRGESLLRVGKWDEAIAMFRRFLEREGSPELEGPAFYNLGEAFYSKADYASARREFDQGRRVAPTYAEPYPLLLFHMGETYYEVAEFGLAREMYTILLQKYPDKAYTKLVALRLGDFLRDEGKEDDALKVYEQVILNATQPIRLRGKMRIANLYAQRPYGEDYRKALPMYDEVTQEAKGDLIGQEARLRKGLTLTLHNQNREAIAALEALKKEYPDSPYAAPGTVNGNIDENLKSLVDSLYHAKDDWEVAKVYSEFRDKYFRGFRFKVTLFQVASAYHRLGLYDEALGLYGDLLKGPAHSLRTLVHYRMAQAYSDRDDLGRAEESLLRFIQDYPADPYRTDTRMLLGDVYTRARRYQDAINAYRLIIQDFEKSQSPELSEAVSEAYFRLGQLFRELGQTKNAEESFVKAIENFHHPIVGPMVPDFVIRSHFAIGDTRFDLNRDAEALQAYQDAIAKYPDHERAPWAWYQIGLVYRRGGNDAKALETFNALVDMAKSRPGEMWEGLARDNQRELTNVLKYRDYLNQ